MPLKYPVPKKEQCIIGCWLVLTWYQIYSSRYCWNLATRLWLWSLWFPGLSFCWETQSWTKRRWCGYLYSRAVGLFSETGSQPVWPKNRVLVCGNRRQYAMQQKNNFGCYLSPHLIPPPRFICTNVYRLEPGLFMSLGVKYRIQKRANPKIYPGIFYTHHIYSSPIEVVIILSSMTSYVNFIMYSSFPLFFFLFVLYCTFVLLIFCNIVIGIACKNSYSTVCQLQSLIKISMT